MRIGILTLPLHNNYGGIVQAYALQTVLERMGHDVKVFNGRYDPTFKLARWKAPAVWLLKCIKRLKAERHTAAFISRYIKTYPIRTVKDIHQSDVDAIVVGSDQIWQLEFLEGVFGEHGSADAFLQFASNWNIKRFAYAASFGVDAWKYPAEKNAVYRELAAKFDGISVREDTGVRLCSEHLGVDAIHLLDPTMLLTPADYLALCTPDRAHGSAGTLFCYILSDSEEKERLIQKVASERGLKPYFIKPTPPYQPVEQWLRSFHDATFVVTDSFHGSAFSILFGKPFVTFGSVNIGFTRLESLMRMFNAEDHLVMSIGDYRSDKSYAAPSDAFERLTAERKLAFDFLRSMSI